LILNPFEDLKKIRINDIKCL